MPGLGELAMPSKSFLLSKTLWFNAVTYLLSHTGVFAALGISSQWQITIVLALNVVLRVVTNGPITFNVNFLKLFMASK